MILDKIVEKKQERINNIDFDNDKDNPFRKRLVENSFSVIGEFKKASPSKGVIKEDFNVKDILKIYEKLDVNCYSVLTEIDYFQGNNEYLKYVSKNTLRPILRKDFIIDPVQIIEAKEIGAMGILLIVSILGNRLMEFYRLAKYIGLTPLVEVHNKEELDIALECDVEIIGINNRDLKTFETSLNVTKELIEFIPKDKVVISESGVNTKEDIEYLKSLGVNGVLIGEAFMRGMKI